MQSSDNPTNEMYAEVQVKPHSPAVIVSPALSFSQLKLTYVAERHIDEIIIS